MREKLALRCAQEGECDNTPRALSPRYIRPKVIDIHLDNIRARQRVELIVNLVATETRRVIRKRIHIPYEISINGSPKKYHHILL